MMYYPNVELISPDSTGIIRTKLNKEQLKPIWDNVKEIEKDFDAHANQSANDGLVGHIQKRILVKEETSRYLDSFILPLIRNILKPMTMFISNQLSEKNLVVWHWTIHSYL